MISYPADPASRTSPKETPRIIADSPTSLLRERRAGVLGSYQHNNLGWISLSKPPRRTLLLMSKTLVSAFRRSIATPARPISIRLPQAALSRPHQAASMSSTTSGTFGSVLPMPNHTQERRHQRRTLLPEEMVLPRAPIIAKRSSHIEQNTS